MKKVYRLSAVIALALSLPSVVLADSNNVYYNNQEDTGFYLQGDLGLAHVRADGQFNNIRKSYNESNFLPRVSIGYDFGQARVAGDYTYYGQVDENINNARAETRAQGVGVSAMYDFPIGRIQPYVGARLAANRIKRNETNSVISKSAKSTKLGAGLLAGVGYEVDKNVTLDAGYRYNHLDNKLNAHEATVGLRYKF